LILGRLDFGKAKVAWAIANLCFVAASFLLLRRRVSDQTLLILLLFFLCSTPVRNSIGNGQQSLLCLFLYILAVYFAHMGGDRVAALIAGLGAFKFSFGVPLAFSFDSNRFGNMVLYAAPTIFGIVLWSLVFERGLIESAFLPLSASQAAIGSADLLSLLRRTGLPQTVAIGVPMVLLIAIAGIQKSIYPIKDALRSFSLYGLLSLLLFYHSSYDHVFLLGSALVACCSYSLGVKLTTFLIISYFWYGAKAISLATSWEPPAVANLILLCVLFGTLVYELQTTMGGRTGSRLRATCA
jgi:hypothetical protein